MLGLHRYVITTPIFTSTSSTYSNTKPLKYSNTNNYFKESCFHVNKYGDAKRIVANNIAWACTKIKVSKIDSDT